MLVAATAQAADPWSLSSDTIPNVDASRSIKITIPFADPVAARQYPLRVDLFDSPPAIYHGAVADPDAATSSFNYQIRFFTLGQLYNNVNQGNTEDLISVSVFDSAGQSWRDQFLKLDIKASQSDCYTALLDGEACVRNLADPATVEVFVRRGPRIFVGRSVSTANGKTTAVITNERYQDETVLLGQSRRAQGSYQIISWKTKPVFSESFLAAQQVLEHEMFKTLRKSDPSIAALSYFSGNVTGCLYERPLSYFRVPADGEYHVTSFVRALPDWSSIGPEFYIYDEEGRELLHHQVHNGLGGPGATFRFEGAYRALGFVTLKKDVRYSIRQSYRRSFYQYENDCGSDPLNDVQVSLATLLVRQPALMTDAVATAMGYASLSELLSVSRLPVSQQRPPSSRFAGANFDSATGSAPSVTDSLPNGTIANYMENFIFSNFGWTLAKHSQQAYTRWAVSANNRCQTADVCLFSEMPLLNQGTNDTCGPVTWSMALAGLLSELDQTKAPIKAGSWLDQHWSRVINASRPSKDYVENLLGPNGVVNPGASPEIDVEFCAAGYTPGCVPQIPAEGLDYSIVRNDSIWAGYLNRAADFNQGAWTALARNPVLSMSYFKNLMQPTAKYAIGLDVDFVKPSISTSALGLTSISFQVDPNFRGTGTSAAHAVAVNGYVGDDLLIYNPWQTEHYMQPRTISASTSLNWQDNAGASVDNQVVSLPGATSSATYLSPSNWAASEVHPESYYWFVSSVESVRAESITPPSGVSLPVIKTQPADMSAVASADPTLFKSDMAFYATARFAVELEGGFSGMSFQWQRNGVSIPGATKQILEFTPLSSDNMSYYSVAISNAAGTVTSRSAQLLVGTISVPQLTISSSAGTTSPTQTGDSIVSICQGQKTGLSSFRQDLSFENAIRYQWLKNGVPIANEVFRSMQFTVTGEDAQAKYQLEAVNPFGKFVSTGLIFDVLPTTLPVIQSQPIQGSTPLVGESSYVSMAAQGCGIQYQWRRNGVPVPGANSARLNITAAASDEGAIYDAVVSNGAGSVTSSPVTFHLGTSGTPVNTNGTFSGFSLSCGSMMTYYGYGTAYPKPKCQWYAGSPSIPFGAPVDSVGYSGNDVTKTGNYTCALTAPLGRASSAYMNGVAPYSFRAFNANGTSSIRPIAPIMTSTGTTLSIQEQPQAQTVEAGQSVGFRVTYCGGKPAISWRRNGVPIAGQTGPYYLFTASMSDNGALYDVVLSGSTVLTSIPVHLTVTAPGGAVPPSITTHPASQTVNSGANVMLTVSGTGAPTPAYQWYFNGTPIAGATQSSYSFTAGSGVGGDYKVQLTNAVGSVMSNPATVTVVGLPLITAQPQGGSGAAGSNFTLSVGASSNPTPSYQWYRNGTVIPGAIAATYSFTLGNDTVGKYQVMLSNSLGSTMSQIATVVLNSPPSITLQPQSQLLLSGTSTTLSVVGGGTPAPSYQWYRNGTAIGGATADKYNFAVSSTTAGDYTVALSNPLGSITSAIAKVEIGTIPVITTQPVPQVVAQGSTLTLSVVGTASPPPQYQWYRNDVKMAGMTSPTVTLLNVGTSWTGLFYVVLTNQLGSVQSETVQITVTP